MIQSRFRKAADNMHRSPGSVSAKRRRLRHEMLEERRLLAVGPTLLGIDHNNGVLIQDASVHQTAPRELTFRFDEAQVLDRTTLGGITLTRSVDGIFDNANDLPISPSYLDLGQTSYTVVMRFPETLPDDMYRIKIAGTGPTRLMNMAGIPFGDDTDDNISNGSNYALKFDLQLGAQVISVVPQPVTRDPATGTLTQAKDKIEVYFNNDTLNQTSASNPAFYRLIDTQSQSLLFPQSVAYDAALNKAVLTFPIDLSTATYQLQIGETEESNGSASQATDLGTIAQQAKAVVYSNQSVTSIPDNSSVLSGVSVLDTFLVADVNVEVDIDHTWGPDLRVFLQGPGGQRVELIRDLGSDVRGGQIYGVKYQDQNSNGTRDANELGLPGWTIFIDSNGNSQRDPGERSTVTDAQGRYSFLDLDLGQTYRIVEIPQASWQSTSPTRFISIGTGPQQQVFKNINFGSNRIPTVGPDAYGYQATGVPTTFEDISTTGSRVLQSPIGTGSVARFGGAGDESVTGMARDSSGNVYLTGSFQGTVDFDPGPGNAILTSAGGDDIFVVKYDFTGGLIWARQAGGLSSDFSAAVAVDANNSVFISGSFLQTASFGTTNLISNGLSDLFVWKLDGAGNSVWARGLGGAGNDAALGVAADNMFVVATGAFSSTVDFDPGPGSAPLTSKGSTDAFVLQLSTAGDLFWVRQLGDSGADAGHDVHITSVGNVVTTGSFSGTVDFNPGSGANMLASAGIADGFIQQMDASGNYQWAQRFGSAATSDQGSDVDVEINGDVYLSGVSNSDIIVQRMTSAGTVVWTRTFGGASADRGEAIDVAPDGTVIVGGSFRGAVTFGSTNRVAVGGSDAFVLRLNPQGNFISASTFGGSSDDATFAVLFNASDSVLATGIFRGTSTFTLGASTQGLTSAGGADGFFALIPVVTGLDDGTYQLTPGQLNGFAFNFYGTSYNTLHFSSNGLISFAAPNASGANTNLLNSPTDPVIAAFWDDLRTGAADSDGVFWEVRGSGANQRLVIQWENVTLDNANAAAVGPMDFQAVLNENDGSIQLNYRAIAAPQVIAGPVRAVGTSTTGSQITPAIAADANGNYVVVWNSPNQDGSGDGIFGRRFTAAGGAIGNEFQINQTSAGSQALPQIAMNSSGNFVVTWTGNGVGDTDGVFARTYSPLAIANTNEFLVHQDPIGIQQSGSVGISSAGNIAIAWNGQGPDDAAGVYVRRFDFDGQPLGAVNEIQRMRLMGPPVVGATFTLFHAGNQTAPIVVANPSQTAVNIRDALRALPSLGDTLTVTSLPTANEVQTLTFTGSPASGTFTLEFEGQTTAAITYAGVGQGAATATNIQTALVALTKIGTGNVTVTSFSDTVFNVTFVGAMAGTDQSPLALATNSLNQGSLSVAETTVGTTAGQDFDVLFQGTDGGRAQPLLVHGDTRNGATHIEFSARQEGSNGELRVNNEMTNTQDSPRLDMAPTGEFTISWTSQLQDGSLGGVYAKRYSASGQAIQAEADEVQRLTLDGPPAAGSTFRLQVGGSTTGPIDYTGANGGAVTAANIQSAIRFLPRMANVTVTPVVGNSNEVQRLSFTAPLPGAGTFRLSHRGQITADIVFAGIAAADAATTATNIQTALRALPNAGAGLTVTAAGPFTFTVNFIGAVVGGIDHPPLVLALNNLNQGGLSVTTIDDGGKSPNQFVVTFAGPSGRLDQQNIALADNTNGVATITVQEIVKGVNSEFQVNDQTNNAQTSGDTVIRPDGSYFIVWQSNLQDGDLLGVFGKLFSANGSVLRDEFQINTFTQSNQGQPKAGVDGAGNLVVTWVSANQDGSQNGVYARRFRADGFPQGDEFLVNTLTAGNQSSPSIVVNPDGTFAIAFSSVAGQSGIQVQRYTAAGLPSGVESQVSELGARQQTTPQIARSSNGTYVVVWNDTTRDTDLSNGIYAQIFDANHNPLSSEFQVNELSLLAQSQPSVDIDDAGRIVIVWRSQQPGPGNTIETTIRGRRFNSAGTPLSSEFQISTSPLFANPTPDVDIDPASGKWVVVWEHGPFVSDYTIRGRVYAADGLPSTPELTLQTQVNLAVLPRAAMNAAGEFAVVWTGRNPATLNNNVNGRLFNANGSPKALAFQVNEGLATAAVDDSGQDIAVDSDGIFTVVWDRANEAYVRRFNSNGTFLISELDISDAAGVNFPRISVASDNSLVVTWSAPSGTFVQRLGADAGLIGNNVLINNFNLPVVAAGSPGTFIVAGIDNASGIGGLHTQAFTTDSATVGIKGAGVQVPGGNVLPIWVDGARSLLVGSNMSLTISRVFQTSERLFAINSATNQLLELNSITGATLGSYPLPVAAGTSSGLAYAAGTVYYIPGNASALFELDPNTGNIVDVTPLSSISASGIAGLAYLNGQVVILDATTGTLIFIDPYRDVELRRLMPASTLAGGLVGGGSRGSLFAINAQSQIVEINATSGAVVRTLASPGANLVGLALVDGVLLASNNAGTVYRLNPDTGAALGSLPVAAGLSALGADGGGGFAAALGGNYQPLTDAILDDEASISITEGVGSYTGRYRPIEPLSAFDGTNVGGAWRLEVQDTATGDTGVLNGWRLRINESQDTPADVQRVGFIGDNTTQSTAPANDVDLYRFNVLSGGVITVDALPSAGLNLAIRLFDSQGNPLRIQDVAGAGAGEQLNYQASASGVFFVGISSSGNSTYDVVTGSGAVGGTSSGSYSLELRFDQSIAINDSNSSFDTATPIGTLGVGGQAISTEIRSAPYGPALPGALNEPGHRHIQPETHLGGGSGLTTAFYNFQDNYGLLPSGAVAVNAITEIQKQRAREIFEMYSQELGIQFIETANEGLTVVTGDLRVIQPNVPGGPGGVAGISQGSMTGLAIVDAAENWGDSEYGGGWFVTAMHEIGHSLGLGHTYDLPDVTVMGGFGVGEPVFPGDHDLVHGKHLYKPSSIDQDLYKFTLNQDGILTAETIAERLAPNASLLDSVITLYREVSPGRRELIASNDDYYSNDSFLKLRLTRGTYYIDVSASGNTGMDPTISNTGFGGTSQGDYQLSLNFEPDIQSTIVDSDAVALDGDADGVPGGRFNFYFESGPTIFVDKMADATPAVDGNGSLASPLDNIYAATELARQTLSMPRDGGAGVVDGEFFVIKDPQNRTVRFEFDNNGAVSVGSSAVPFTANMTGAQLATSVAGAINLARTSTPMRLNVTATIDGTLVRLSGTQLVDASGASSLLNSQSLIRIIGNGGADKNASTLSDNRAYLLGMDGNVVLQDGASLEVPQGVTVMVDANALFKLREANFDVGTSAEGVDRRQGALQILGKPSEQVSFYSYRNDAVGGDSDGPGAGASKGDWGGLVFRDDSDMEAARIYLNWVNNATMDSGGGRLLVNSVEETFTPIHLIGARPAVTNNTIRQSADAAISADPASFSDLDDRIGPDIHGNRIVSNSINGLFVRIDTQVGSTIDTITQPSRWNDTDIVHVLTENLFISGTPGGPVKDAASGIIQARIDGRLTIDPGIVVKLGGARIETALGGQLIAEGTKTNPIIFTTLTNDSYGGSGSFDTQNDASATSPASGQWGGLFFAASAQGSLDHVLINYAGGMTPIEGGFDRFNAVEIHQADVRLTNSIISDNEGLFAATDRNGRGTNSAATIFVRGAQPIIVNNLFQDNRGTVIQIDANALQAVLQADYGRTTGQLDQFEEFADNYGPLVRLNRLQNNGVNGMEVRGAVLTTETVWDDADIAHVLRSEISVLNHHTFSGLHLLSNQNQSLVVKLSGPTAGFTANGTLLDIDDRIGGSIYVGSRGLPVVLTSLSDDTAIAGVDFFGLPLGDTNNNGPSSGTPGNWNGILLDRFSNDRNVSLQREAERAFSGQADTNRKPADAEFLGNLAPNEKSGDVDRRLGFEIHGNISADNSQDVDVYSFSGVAGTEVYVDLDQTGAALDSMLELIDASGNVLARSLNSTGGLSGLALPLIKASHLGGDFYSISDRDAGMRVILPGVAGQTNTYFVRVRSTPLSGDVENLNGGLTRGDYKLQIRLRQVDEKPGSFIRNADIRYATNAIQVIGLPGHSPLIGESVETRAGSESLGAAQPLGNLLVSDRNTLSVGGTLSNATDVDWYRFEIDYDKIQSIAGFNGGGKTFATIFDIDYADGLGRPDTVMSVFDANGNLIMVSRDSNIEDDQPGAGQGADTDDLSRGSFGPQDAFIGTVQMPAGVPGSTTTYYVAISSNSQLPTALNGTFTSGASNTLVRLEPMNSLTRIAEDHIGLQGYHSGNFLAPVYVPPTTQLFNISTALSLSTSVVPFTLNDITLYTASPGTNGLKTVNPYTGDPWTNVGSFPTNGRSVGDISMRSDGRLFAVEGLGGAAGQNTAGRLLEVDPGTGALTVVGNDNIPDFDPATTPLNLQQLTSSNIDALAWRRTDVATYDLFYSVRGARRGAGVLPTGTSTLYRADPNSGSAAVAQGQPWGRVGEIFRLSPGDLGETTGMAFIGAQMYGVSNTGLFYQISGSGQATNVVNLGTPLSGLTLGPQNAENGRYANMLFASTADGQIFALDAAGTLQNVFRFGTSATTGTTGNVGIAFSPLDFNLWHPTMQRKADPGHGIEYAFDNSRTPDMFLTTINGRQTNQGEGGASFRFGLEQWVQNNTNAYFNYGPNAQYGIRSEATHRDLSANPQQVDNYNLPGGAMGSLATATISLAGYASADKPTLYFNYFLETEGVNSITNPPMLDSARVLVSQNGGITWELLATNNSVLSTNANAAELPRFISPSVEASPTDPQQQVQELFDNTGGWRQARIDLSNYAGRSQLQFRFDFSTAGQMIGPNGVQSGDPSLFGSLTSNRRGQNNAFEGFYVDDIIVGFAERGEMVTQATSQSQFFTIPPNPNPSDPSEILFGDYQLEIRRGTEFGDNVDTLNPNIFIYQTLNTNDRLTTPFFRLGDSNLHREQGQILISSNTITDSSQFGIVVDAGVRDAGGSLSRPGGVRNLPTINNQRLTAGTKIENNIVANFGTGGIRFSGDPNSGSLPLSSVPFGRIVNNTIYGGDVARGTGIEVTENASPTILNNILSNTSVGLSVDATSATTVLGANLFQGNGVNGPLGTNSIVLPANAPLFVNALQGNFYPAAGSQAIDGSLNVLAERANLEAVTSPLGIPPAPILAPDRDRFGQLRLDDPAQDPPPGLGSNVFKDRGAVERADFQGPTARLTEPLDNDGLGLDLSPLPNEVLIQPAVISQITIQLSDQGIGIDDLSVTVDNVQISLDGQLMVAGTDYEFVYDATNNVIILRALKNNGPVSNRYEILLANQAVDDIRDLAGNRLAPNQPSGQTRFLVVTGGSTIDLSIPDFTLAANQVNALEDNERELGVVRTTIPGFASNLPPVPGIGDPAIVFGTVSITNAGMFSEAPSIDATTGTLTFTTAPDRVGSSIIVMRLTEVGTTSPKQSASQTFTITLAPVNDAPQFTLPTTLDVFEDQGVLSIADFALGMGPGPSTAVDEAGQTVTPTVTALDPNAFLVLPTIDATGRLQFQTRADFNSLISDLVVTVSARDDGSSVSPNVNQSPTKTFTINVIPVNDPPSFSLTQNRINVFEDNEAFVGLPQSQFPGFAANFVAGPATAQDELSQTIDFVLTAAQPDLFSQQPDIDSNGMLTFRTAPNRSGTTLVVAELRDNGASTPPPNQNTSTRVTFTIALAAVNDPPEFTIPQTYSVQEDAGLITQFNFASGIRRGPADAIDESSQLIHFEVVPLSPSAFTVTPTMEVDGSLRFQTAANVNSSNADLRVMVRLIDNGVGAPPPNTTQSAFQTFTLVVAPVNDNPVPNAFSVQGSEDTNLNIPAADILLGDVAGPTTDELSQLLRITQVETTTALGGTVQPVFFQSAIVSMIYTPPQNAVGQDSFLYIATDDGAPNRSGTGTITVNIAAVNDAPTFSSSGNITANEDAGAVTTQWALDILAGPTGAFDELSGPAAQNVNFDVQTNNAALFSVAPAINSNGVLTFTAAPDAIGSAVVTVVAVDDGDDAAPNVNRSTTATFTIQITPVNDAPVFTSGGNVSVDEDSSAFDQSWATGVAPAPGLLLVPPRSTEEAGQTVTFTATNDRASLFSVAPSIDSSGRLRFTPAPNAHGAAVVTVIANDSGPADAINKNQSSPQSFTITVSAINDAPVGVNDQYSATENSVLTVGAAGVLSNDSDIDLPTDQLTAVLASGTSASGALVTLNADGSFTYDPRNASAIQSMANQEVLSDTFTYRVRDAAGSTSDLITVTVAVTAVNDAPQAIDDRIAIVPGQTAFLAVLANDIDVDTPLDNDSIEFGRLPVSGTAIALSSGLIQYTPIQGFRGVDTLSYRVRDSLGLLSNEAFVTIKTNEAPIAAQDTATTTFGLPVTINVLANDRDSDGTIDPSSVNVVVPANSGTAVVNAAGEVVYTPPANFAGVVVFSYTVKDDDGTLSNSADVTVRIGSSAFQNQVNNFDVNGDGFVSPIDALLIINDINIRGSRPLTPGTFTPPPYIDVNGSRSVEPADVLLVINFLNTSQTINGSGEGEAHAEAALAPPIGTQSLVNPIAFDQAAGLTEIAVRRQAQVRTADMLVREFEQTTHADSSLVATELEETIWAFDDSIADVSHVASEKADPRFEDEFDRFFETL